MTLWPIKRRDFIKMAGASTIAATFPGVALAKNNQFPSGFLWGAGSAAAQVESRQGRGQSNWDLFIDQGHRIKDGTSNVMNTDFQNRFMEDFRPLANAGLQSFRFSFAWPRIQPEQAGSLNQNGI